MSVEEKKVTETSTKDNKKEHQVTPVPVEVPKRGAAPTDDKKERQVPAVPVDAPKRGAVTQAHNRAKVGNATSAAHQRAHNPAKVGKANPKRDIPIFLGLVGLLFLIAYSTSGIGGTKEVEKKKSVKQLQEDLRRSMETAYVKEQTRKRIMECGLFIASSSIPGTTGLGIFAGKRFEVGDEVIHPGVFYPVLSQQDTGKDENIFVSQYGFLLKHHPFLANLQGGPIWSEKAELSQADITSLKAARIIEPGEELFLSAHEHPQDVLQARTGVFDLPTLEDYEMADEIVRDEVRTQRRGAATRRAGAQSMGGGGALMMVKRVVEKFNKKVAALLPGSAKGLETRDLLATSSAFSALTNRTVSYLETHGQCLDDVRVKPRVASSTQMGLFARRLIKKGKLIVPAPLYTRRRDGSCSADDVMCTASTVKDSVEHCFGHRDSSLLLCPLSSASFVQVASRDNDSVLKANAALKWSSRINIKKIRKVPVDEVFKNYTTSLVLDIVALRVIEPGEEILIDGVKDSVIGGGSIHVDDSLYSTVWKDYELVE